MSDSNSTSGTAALANLQQTVLLAAGLPLDRSVPYTIVFEIEAARGMRGFKPDSKASTASFEHSPEIDEACERVIDALDLVRGDETTSTRLRFSSTAPPSYETRIEEPDPRTVRYEAWRSAIAERVRGVAPDADPTLGYMTMIGYKLGGPDPLGWVMTVRRDEPVPHWLYVTTGFSEEDDDVEEASADPERPSGYGFELTFRIPRDPHASGDAPAEYVVMLQTLARYVFKTGNVFRDGDYTALEDEQPGLDGIKGFAFVADPELGEFRGPGGTIEFRSAIGLRASEMDAIKLWNATGFIDLAIAHGKLSPNGITDPARASFLGDPAFAAEARAAGARDGSRTGHLFMPDLSVRTTARFLRSPATVVTLDPAGSEMAAMLLPNRIGFGRGVTLIGQTCTVRFDPAEQTTVDGEPNELRVGLTPRDAVAIASAASNRAKQYDFRDAPLTIVLRP